MSVRLKFPRGSDFSFLRQAVKDGAAVDITGATLAGYLKRSPSDADADAIAPLTIGVVSAADGLVRITVPAAATATADFCIELYWQARATLASGFIVAPECMHGPVMPTPFQLLYSPEVMEEIMPDNAYALLTMANQNFIGVRADVTTAALHRAVVTVGQVLPWVINTLEDGSLCTWTLRAKIDGETDDGTTYRQPTDWNATTNNVIWVRTPLS